ncbi:MAG: CHRD domain-containing protein [Paludisphaera borealis]|uniref:CHRD domain-containing protein n=1 Tax=Paludisphaera borealis TaxID=1387353 RepID=UPI002848EBCC|nr:CHRD domain-containing protein [Paludisphaera borealis]MDR3619925.1 CHRD domain-containing protein [Paludisphaera borealis]
MVRSIGFVALAIGVFGFSLAPRTHAGIISYTAHLDGLSESPPNASPGIGFAEVDIDDVGQTMRVQVTFSGLLGTTTASHIHSPTLNPGGGTAGVATQTPTFAGFPLGVTSGTYDRTFDLTDASTYNTAFVTSNGGTVSGAEAALLAGLAAGKAYLNIHTSVAPGGEIRGFLRPVPEPASLALAAVGGLCILAARLRRPNRIS